VSEQDDQPKRRGFTMIPHAATAVPGMSDAAFRAWVALDRWAWSGKYPSNAQLAAACGWVTEKGAPSAIKAKRALYVSLRILVSLGGLPPVPRVGISARGSTSSARRNGSSVTQVKMDLGLI
jgi:hypothetical protein